MPKTQQTELHNAPPVQVPAPVQTAQPAQSAPRQKRIERQGGRTEPYVHFMPEIRGGICEWCGVLDPNTPAQFQYQLCPHFRGLGEMRCSYCDQTKNPTEVVTRSVLHIMDNPYNPDELIVVCNSYDCEKAHQERFRVSR